MGQVKDPSVCSYNVIHRAGTGLNYTSLELYQAYDYDPGSGSGFTEISSKPVGPQDFLSSLSSRLKMLHKLIN